MEVELFHCRTQLSVRMGWLPEDMCDHLLKRFATGVNGDDGLPDVAMQAEPIQISDAAEEKQERFATEEVVEDESNTGLPSEHPMSTPMLPRRSQPTRRD